MLASLQEVKTYLEISDTSQDEKINLLLQAADEYVKKACGRQFEYGTYTEKLRFYDGIGYLNETPIEAINSVKDLNGNSYTVSYIVADSGVVVLEADLDSIATVEYVGGYQTIPNDLKLAVIRIVEYLMASTEGVKTINLEGITAGFEPFTKYVSDVIEKYKGLMI